MVVTFLNVRWMGLSEFLKISWHFRLYIYTNKEFCGRGGISPVFHWSTCRCLFLRCRLWMWDTSYPSMERGVYRQPDCVVYPWRGLCNFCSFNISKFLFWTIESDKMQQTNVTHVLTCLYNLWLPGIILILIGTILLIL